MPINKDRILYQDEQYLAVHKLAGELVVKGKGAVGKLPLFDFLRKEYPGIHPVNRLDFDTSGIVLFAKNKPILARTLQTKFAGWKKVYRTVVAGRVARDKGEIRLSLPTRAKGEMAAALTLYRTLERFSPASYMEAEIESGRHHQIRRHFAMIHHPLVLDMLYGERKFNGPFGQAFHFHKIFLHAFSLTFPHPYTGAIVHIESPMPKVFEGLLAKLKRTA